MFRTTFHRVADGLGGNLVFTPVLPLKSERGTVDRSQVKTSLTKMNDTTQNAIEIATLKGAEMKTMSAPNESARDRNNAARDRFRADVANWKTSMEQRDTDNADRIAAHQRRVLGLVLIWTGVFIAALQRL